MNICKTCFNKFKPIRKNNWYCSIKCKNIYREKENRKRADEYYWKHRDPTKPYRIFKPIKCIKCHQIKKHKAHGLCKKCYKESCESKWKFGNKKEIIYKRDNFTCQHCNLTMEESFEKWNQKLTVHHIDKNIFNIADNNLITLCRSCHAKIHNPGHYSYSKEYKHNYSKKYYKEVIKPNRTRSQAHF